MKKDFVYFFKHNNINAIKIGKTSGESVLDRFNSFRTYAPFGAEIVGFFETDNGHKDEKELHQLFKSHRLQGEFFDISIDIVKSIIFQKNKDYHKAFSIFNEWMANDENDSSKLVNLMSRVKFLNVENIDVLSKKGIEFIKNNYKLDEWYQFKDSYNDFLKNQDKNPVSKMYFKKLLETYARINDFKIETKRKSSDNNNHYFKFS